MASQGESSTRVQGPLITIAVPFVSGLAYLRKALDSVFLQTRSDWALVLCENCVDPHEREAARALLESYGDPRASFHQGSEHVSMGANFNRCIGVASTDLVTILHSDDELLPTYVETVIAIESQHRSASMLFFRAITIGSQGQPVYSFVDSAKKMLAPRSRGAVLLIGEAGLRSLMIGNFIMAPTVCFRKSQLGAIKWSETLKFTLDLDLYCKALIAGKTIVGIRGAAQYAYRRHTGSTTAALSQNLYRFVEESATFDAISSSARSIGWHKAARAAERKTTLRLHLLLLAASDLARGRFRSAASKLRLLPQMDSR